MIAAGTRPPAVLVVNPFAGRLSHASREEVVTALAERFRLEVFTTTGRDTGIDLAHEAATNGVGLVIAFGGDGHVNEVVNGLAGTATALGIIPGGTMNVFARALGIPRDPMEAIEHLAAVAGAAPRRVHLGRVDGRYFTFSAGCGFDAEAAELVERDIPNKRRFGEVFFYWSAFRVLAGTHRHRNPTMTLKGAFGEVRVSMAIACNTGPYAYLAGRSVRIAPEVRLEGGLDVFALKRMRIEALPGYAWGSVVRGDVTKHRDAFYVRDLDSFSVSADEPFHRHVDGEPLEPASSCVFELAENILKVKA
ncbi:MAG TPA: diacylglycerol kinase family protein [Actinomycetota bacterium]|nr:diacylglycerol kinase family protein [Actinomycetota bacterium]